MKVLYKFGVHFFGEGHFRGFEKDFLTLKAQRQNKIICRGDWPDG